MFFRARIVSVVGLAVALPSFSYAADTFSHLPQLLGGSDSMESLQRAYQAVRQDPFVRDLLRDGATHSLSIASRVNSYGIETTKFQHYYKGVEVFGSKTFHHASASGEQVQNTISQFDLDVRPNLSAQDATAIAKTLVGDRELETAPELKILPGKDGSARLIYWVDIANDGLKAGSELMIDAHTGKVIANLSKMEELAPVQVMTAKSQGLAVLPIMKKNDATGKFELKGCKLTDLGKSGDEGKTVSVSTCKLVLRGLTPMTDNICQLVLLDEPEAGRLSTGSPLAVDPAACRQAVTNSSPTGEMDSASRNALENSNKVLAYYKNVHGRDSFDGQGGELVNVVHAGLNYVNAAWVKGLNFMMYGDGNRDELFDDMTKGLDVAGHEITHGITSVTAKLVSMDESGALNEAYSDYFGKMIAQDGSWVVGESLSLDKSKNPGLRDLANPHSIKDVTRNADGDRVELPYPAKASEAMKKNEDTECDSSNDRCWVHFNATVPGHASYLINQAIGKQKAEALYYLTLTSYLTETSDFKAAATATLKACALKFDVATCDKVRAAFVETEML